eukprot:gnl/TRDRNA2_/TRDRNA2_150489_c0_seq1.p1 gnl/TRDRNA2_/TRDRNA2_150489_c0~~gnl/TRDRNA2_/TRDRNA2_150489_c0_seq1.p1  ORF type:complete len:346 (+),score=40.47 gnl/TRDRNA2_/TRDRNA2_150489_c0_seq1:61-1098(+)
MDGPQKKRLRVAGPEEVASDFRRLIDNAELGDVQFVLDEGPPIHGNKALLASRCAHFHHLFFGSGSAMQEGSGSSVNIKDCPREAFLGFLHLLYTGSTETVDAVALVEIHRLLDRYNMPQLADHLQESILGTLTDETILSAAEAAQRGGQLALRDKIAKKIGRHMGSVVRGAASTLSRELLVSILCNILDPNQWEEPKFGQGYFAGCLATKGISDLKPVMIRGQVSGWNGAMFAVSDHTKFSVQGISVGIQVSLWVWKLQPEGDRGLHAAIKAATSTDRRPWPISLHCHSGDCLHLSFASWPTPSAKLLINGEEILSQSFDAGDDEYRPVLICGDRDGLDKIRIT